MPLLTRLSPCRSIQNDFVVIIFIVHLQREWAEIRLKILFAFIYKMFEEVSASEEKILVVEDERDLVSLLEYNLAKKGYVPMAALDGLTACRMIEERQPDLILLDIMLPDLSGWEVCRIVRNHKNEKISNTPIIMLTALSGDEDRLKGLKLGANYYISKPFEIRNLLLNVASLISGGKGQQ